MARITSALGLVVSLSLAAAAAACSASSSGAGDQSTSADTTTVGDGGVQAPIAQTINPQIVSALAAAGMTVDTLPATLDEVKNDPNHAKLHAVMQTFTIALGTTCEGCHQAGVDGGHPNFDADTPRKNVAKKMWSEFVAKLQKHDGTAIYCDTCHQGQVEFLDRSNTRNLSAWMKTNFVQGLKAKDGTPQECMACHGDPFNGSFLDDWEQPDPPAPTDPDAGN